MSFIKSLVLTLAALTTVIAQTPTPTTPTAASTAAAGPIQIATSDTSPSQRAAFSAGLASYYSSFLAGPEPTALGIALLVGGVPGSVIESIRANPSQLLPVSGTVDMRSIATNPPLTFPSYSWYSQAGSGVQNEVQSMQTSAALAIASIAQADLGITTSLNVPTPKATNAAARNGAAAMMGVAGVAGVAAALL